jgi:hypothetical protein
VEFALDSDGSIFMQLAMTGIEKGKPIRGLDITSKARGDYAKNRHWLYDELMPGFLDLAWSVRGNFVRKPCLFL